MVEWCAHNLHRDGSSFTWHQPCNNQAAAAAATVVVVVVVVVVLSLHRPAGSLCGLRDVKLQELTK